MKQDKIMRQVFIIFTLCLLVPYLQFPLNTAPHEPRANSAEETLISALKAVAFNYAKSYEEGDVATMEGLLHPQFSKAGTFKSRKGEKKVSLMNAGQLLGLVKKNSQRTAARKAKDLHTKVQVLATHGDTATVLLEDDLYVEYLQLIKIDKTWKIIHVLWTTAPGA